MSARPLEDPQEVEVVRRRRIPRYDMNMQMPFAPVTEHEAGDLRDAAAGADVSRRLAKPGRDDP